MPLLELSTLVPLLAVHQLVATGHVTYDTPLRASWPACAAAAAAGYTVGDALCRLVPIDGSMLWREPAAKLADLAVQHAALAAAPLRPTDGPRLPRSAGAADGTLLSGIVQGVCEQPYARALASRLLLPLRLSGALHTGALAEPVQSDAATLSTGFAAQLQRFSAMGQQGAATPLPAAEPPDKPETAEHADKAGADKKADAEKEEKATRVNAGVAGAASRFAHEIPLNAGVVNSSLTRAGCVPGLGAFGTARAVCTLLGAAARGETGPLAALSATAGVEASFLFGNRAWARGVQRYDATAAHTARSLSTASVPSSHCGVWIVRALQVRLLRRHGSTRARSALVLRLARLPLPAEWRERRHPPQRRPARLLGDAAHPRRAHRRARRRTRRLSRRRPLLMSATGR
jgi:hypothetical protein